MTDHIEPTDLELESPAESSETSSGIFSGLSEVTWALVGTGFLMGILIGSIFIVGRASSSGGLFSCSTESSEAPLTVASPSPQAVQSDSLGRELEIEKMRLKVAKLQKELADLRNTAGTDGESDVIAEPAPDSTEPETQPVSTTTADSPIESTSPGDATLVYWTELNAIIAQEAAMRAAPVGGVTAANAGGFLDARLQAAEFAVTNIRELETAGVDTKVTALGEDLAKWYEAGHDVAEQGLHLMTKATPEERQGAPGRKYQAAEKALSKQVNEINTDGERVRRAMSEKYGVEFPPLN
ncbi:MAG: hypothetical protein KDA93_08385 [Planctomycetaceae bacterium]|nr:hypothetical protein [Planctomycetaceae bacterium]